jgi:ABC-2 type transport system permease protein
MALPIAARPRSTAVYDSAQRTPPLVNEALNLWRYRGLLALLVTRDLTVRYKRSVLGVWWTLLNPLLTSAIMYVIFSNVFRFNTDDTVPFSVYLLSGILLVNFFGQGLNAVGVSLVSSAGVLSKVYAPPEVFAAAAAAAAAVNFTFSLLPLLLVQLVTGTGVPWTALLVPIPIVALLLLIAGLGLLVATAAIRFPDTLDLTTVGVLLISYLTPTFYPLSIVPERFLLCVYANPLYSYLAVFRGLVYGGTAAPLWNWVVMLVTAAVAIVGGTWVFSRRWPKLAAML